MAAIVQEKAPQSTNAHPASASCLCPVDQSRSPRLAGARRKAPHEGMDGMIQQGTGVMIRLKFRGGGFQPLLLPLGLGGGSLWSRGSVVFRVGATWLRRECGKELEIGTICCRRRQVEGEISKPIGRNKSLLSSTFQLPLVAPFWPVDKGGL